MTMLWFCMNTWTYNLHSQTMITEIRVHNRRTRPYLAEKNFFGAHKSVIGLRIIDLWLVHHLVEKWMTQVYYKNSNFFSDGRGTDDVASRTRGVSPRRGHRGLPSELLVEARGHCIIAEYSRTWNFGEGTKTCSSGACEHRSREAFQVSGMQLDLRVFFLLYTMEHGIKDSIEYQNYSQT